MEEMDGLQWKERVWYFLKNARVVTLSFFLSFLLFLLFLFLWVSLPCLAGRLCASKSDRVYLPEWPFNLALNIERGLIQVFDNLHGDFAAAFREPCVIFAGTKAEKQGKKKTKK